MRAFPSDPVTAPHSTPLASDTTRALPAGAVRTDLATGADRSGRPGSRNSRNEHRTAESASIRIDQDPPLVPSAPPARGRLYRYGMLATAASVLLSVAVAFAPSASAAATAPAIAEDAGARTGIMESTAAHPDPAKIPEDFVTEAGYRPVIEAGILVDPHGDCSSPIPLPQEFDLACKAHDLGYDLLRYADNRGHPLGPWARQTADAALEQRMYASCDTRTNPVSRTECQVMAGVASTFVDLNSIRQHYGAPIHEPGLDKSFGPSHSLLPAGIAVLTIGSIAATVAFRRAARTSNSRPRTLAVA
ncbi:MAG: hypothetical protein JWN03_1394 [Nocardia sp.]|uniref:hypothetical protein n=1 Tax=Nocardia sp. TaxID=1821 RepID=UPI00261DAF8B|nr:hypothetical protein [Nocardia sp.]MCU1641119.1 hypothetical protein [Nocardia sp.]